MILFHCSSIRNQIFALINALCVENYTKNCLSREPGIHLFCLFGMILYVPSTIFQLNRDGTSWVEPVLSQDKYVLLKDHNAVTPVRLEPAAPRSRVKHSTTEPLRSLVYICTNNCKCIAGGQVNRKTIRIVLTF